MRKLFYIFIGIILLSVITESGFAQPQSDYALLKRKLSNSPEIGELNKSITNSYLGVDLFHYPKTGVFVFDKYPDLTIRSSFTGIIEPNWNRLIYSEMGEDFVKSFDS